MNEKMFEPVDEEEQRLMRALEDSDPETAPDSDEQRRIAIAAARNTLRKTERINLRLTKRDLVGIKAAAKEEDIPYQTLIGHLVRKYLEERVRERMEITQPKPPARSS